MGKGHELCTTPPYPSWPRLLYLRTFVPDLSGLKFSADFTATGVDIDEPGNEYRAANPRFKPARQQINSYRPS